MPETIWTNCRFPSPLGEQFEAAVKPRELAISPDAMDTYLKPADRDPRLAGDCEIALGQPDPDDILKSTKLRFVQLSSAGYTRYERADLRAHCKKHNIAVCNASAVYAEPCAQHAAAMIYGAARQMPKSVASQLGARDWPYYDIRRTSIILGGGQTFLIVGYGAIAKRLVELMTPLNFKFHAFRRAPRGDENCPTSPIESLDAHLPTADIVVNILPLADSTKLFFNAARFARMKPGTRFFNIGRGDTVDQDALISALNAGQVAQAYLDVTSPEPLPPTHPLWTTPNCHITPHTAGGWDDETPGQIAHFLANLKRFDAGQPLVDRIF